jgi:hypothetical protein
VAWALLGRRDMATSPLQVSGVSLPLSTTARRQILRFAASFVWADCEVAESERRFLDDLARELDLADAPGEVARLLARPPTPEDVDPRGIPIPVADIIRQVALHAIAADGKVDPAEMTMFELLDDLLPRSPPGARDS